MTSAAISDAARNAGGLSEDAAASAFGAILDGHVSDTDIAEFLTTLHHRGETATEIAAAATAMRARMIPVEVRPDAIDVCGTGGDGAQTLNISTAVAIVAAACGVAIAKHGNRAASSLSGATDVLSALGINTGAAPHVAQACVNELGIGYFAAPLYHPALARLAPIRRTLGHASIFNLLGPLCNPAEVSRQLVGVNRPKLVAVFGHVLETLGSAAAVVVCGAGNIDEFSLSGANEYCILQRGALLEARQISSHALNLMSAPLSALRGGTADENSTALLALLAGQPGAYHDVVVFNAAFAIRLATPALGDLADCAQAARTAISSGAAERLLQSWITLSNKS